MLTFKNNKLHIYFGDTSDGIFKHLHCQPSSKKLADIVPFNTIMHTHNVPRLSLLNQTHGIQGMRIDDEDVFFTIDGDYLITDQKNVGIGVLTADCVPLVLYDSKQHAIAIVHAGWRGAVAGIAQKTIEHMLQIWNTNVTDLQIYFGPSAKICCYEVQSDFAQHLDPEFCNHVMIEKHTRWYFDTAMLIELQLIKMGISDTAIQKDYNFCTMCNERFFSHRRQGLSAGRQITIAKLC